MIKCHQSQTTNWIDYLMIEWINFLMPEWLNDEMNDLFISNVPEFMSDFMIAFMEWEHIQDVGVTVWPATKNNKLFVDLNLN